jgi:hypothetical protein
LWFGFGVRDCCSGFGFRVAVWAWDMGLAIRGLEFQVWGLGLDLGFRVLGFRGLGYRNSSLRARDFEFRVWF